MAAEARRLANFVELGFEIWNKGGDEFIKELEKAGNNLEASEEKFLDLIKTAKAELEIEKGERLKELYHIAKIEVQNSTEATEEINYKSAARNLENLTAADEAIISKNLGLLKKLEKE